MNQLQTVLNALEINRVMGSDEQGNYTKEITPKQITEAIAIVKQMMQAEPVAWWITSKTTDEKFVTTRPDDWNYLAWNKHPLYTKPEEK